MNRDANSSKPNDPFETCELLEDLNKKVDEVCAKIAARFNLFTVDGNARKAAIIEMLAENDCMDCLVRTMSEKRYEKVDPLYLECHSTAVSILVEELHRLINGTEELVATSTEAQIEYGKADILIEHISGGLAVKSADKEVLIEVKTGESISLPQILRYLISKPNSTLIVWRIANNQVLAFKFDDVMELAIFFERMICVRGERLLDYWEPTEECGHACKCGYRPSSESMMKAVKRLSENLTETMPTVLEQTMKALFDQFGTSLQAGITP